MSKITKSKYGFKPYRPADVHSRCLDNCHITHITSPDASDTEKNLILEIVEKEQPIDFKLLCRRIAPLYKRNEKITSELYWKVANIITSKQLLGNKLIMYMHFVCTRDYDKVEVRYRTDDKLTERIISQICPEELMQAICLVLRYIGSTNSGRLIDIVRKELGYFASGTGIQAYLNECIKIMQQAGIVSIERRQVSLTDIGREYEYRMGDFCKENVLEIPTLEKVSSSTFDLISNDEDFWFDNIVIASPKGADFDEGSKPSRNKKISAQGKNDISKGVRKATKRKFSSFAPEKKEEYPVVITTDEVSPYKVLLGMIQTLPYRTHDIRDTNSLDCVAGGRNYGESENDILHCAQRGQVEIFSKECNDGTMCPHQCVIWPYWYGSIVEENLCQSGVLNGSVSIEFFSLYKHEWLEQSYLLALNAEVPYKHQVKENNSRLVEDVSACYNFAGEFDSSKSGTFHQASNVLYLGSFLHGGCEDVLPHSTTNPMTVTYYACENKVLGNGVVERLLCDFVGRSSLGIHVDEIINSVKGLWRNFISSVRTFKQEDLPYALEVMVGMIPIPGLVRITSGRYISGIFQLVLCFLVCKWFYLWWALDFFHVITHDRGEAGCRKLKDSQKWIASAGFIAYLFLVASLMKRFLQW